MKYTLKVNIITEEGKLIPFGTVLDESKIPIRVYKPKYVAKGIVQIVTTDVMDNIELEGVRVEEEEQNGRGRRVNKTDDNSPMSEEL